MKARSGWGHVLSFLIGILLAGHAQAMPLAVDIDTSALSGSVAQLAFDFIDGGTPANHMAVHGFVIVGGAPGAESNSGDVIGSLLLPGGVVLGDAAFFSEYLLDITLGTSLHFVLDASGHAADPENFPDSFSFFMLDADSGLPLFGTTNPGGALFAIDIDGTASGLVTIFPADGNVVLVSISPVPEPHPGLLWGLGLFGLLLKRRI